MSETKYCIVVGTFVCGFSVVGPFDSEADAHKWAAIAEENEPFTVEMLHNPQDALFDDADEDEEKA